MDENTYLDAYQHISNGGIGFTFLAETVRNKQHHKLQITLSNHGIAHNTTIPVFATTAAILRMIANEIDQHAVSDPSYLSNIEADIKSKTFGHYIYRNIDGTVQRWFVPEDSTEEIQLNLIESKPDEEGKDDHGE
jgi:hypothetical protein